MAQALASAHSSLVLILAARPITRLMGTRPLLNGSSITLAKEKGTDEEKKILP